MDSISPTYPPFPSSQETNSRLDAIGQASASYPRGPSAAPEADPSPRPRSSHHAPAAPSLDAPESGSGSSSHSPDSPNLPSLQPPHQSHPYSPTRAEIEAHPIRQRLSLGHDEFAPATSAAASFEGEAAKSRLEGSEGEVLSQAQEGSERLFDAMSSEAPAVQQGDAVSYAWGGGRPGGEVTQVATNDSVTMETKRGNEVHKQGEPENPALYIARGSDHDVVKKASEVSIEEKADSNQQTESEKKDDSEEKKAEEAPKPEEKKQENGEPQTGEKRPAEEPAEERKAEEPNGEAKKQKTDDEPKENGEQPKKKGRPAKTDADGKPAAKKETKKRAPKKAATASGEPRRSGRVAGKSAD